jgi:hypothetical protein
MRNKFPFLKRFATLWFRWHSVTLALVFITACAISSKRSGESAKTEAAVLAALELENKTASTSVTIDYELGKDHYQLQVVSDKNTTTVKSYSGKHLLKQGPIVRDKYLLFLNKANLFINTPQNISRKSYPRRGPFRVTVKSGESTKTAEGYRSDDEGSFSRLIREGEFLLYSEN